MTAKQGDKPKVVHSFKVDPELLEEAKLIASLIGVTLSGQLEVLLREWVKKASQRIPPEAMQNIEAIRKAFKKKN